MRGRRWIVAWVILLVSAMTLAVACGAPERDERTGSSEQALSTCAEVVLQAERTRGRHGWDDAEDS
ncbi:MAG: hypothetical protein KC657_39295, partial [Myxococcales bacterium]|nr:hypothetical protein [Myxococcales bacterium]